jgi:hypothetical protein
VEFWDGALLELVVFEEHGKALHLLLKLPPKLQQKNVLNKEYEMHVYMFGDRGQDEKLQFEEFTKRDFE